MTAFRGYTPVKGKIRGHSFQQTLVTVKDSAYRLYVNGSMLKGSGTKVGDTVSFIIEQDTEPKIIPMPKELKSELDKNALLPAFKKLTAGRQKEILRYLNFLKTQEALLRNIEKVIRLLTQKNERGII